MSDSAVTIDEIFQYQEAELDTICEEIKAKVRLDLIESNRNRVRPEAMPETQWAALQEQTLREADEKVDDAFRQQKLLLRCSCDSGLGCRVHPAGRPQ